MNARLARTASCVPLLLVLLTTSTPSSASVQECAPVNRPATGPAPVPGTPLIHGQYFGWTVARGGDVDGDCYADIVVGSQGRTYVMRGGQAPGGAWQELQPQDGYLISNRVSAGVGDLDGDGYDDVGAQQFSLNQAAVYRGGAVMDTFHDARFAGEHGFIPNGPSFATSLSGGDFNGDGYDDLVVGETAGLGSSGAVYLYLGAANIFSAPEQVRTYHDKLEPESLSTTFGSAVRFLGDVNADGYEDIGFCEPGNRKAYIVFGNAWGNLDPWTWRVLSVFGATSFGSSIAGGDVDGDGDADVIVGGPSQSEPGRAWIFQGPAGYSPWTTLVAESCCTLFGSAVDLSDVDGDGRADALVSESGWQPSGWSGFPPGRVRLYSLAYVPRGEPAELVATYEGDAERDRWGEVLAAVGDVNRDGVDDFAVGGHDRSTVTGSLVVPHLGVVRCPRRHPGDYTFDKQVNLADLGIFSGYLNALDPRADLSCDGMVNLWDVSMMSSLNGTTYP